MYMCVRDIDFVSKIYSYRFLNSSHSVTFLYFSTLLRVLVSPHILYRIFKFMWTSVLLSVESNLFTVVWPLTIYLSKDYNYYRIHWLNTDTSVCLFFLSGELHNSLRFRFRCFISLKSNWCLLFVYWKLKCEHVEWAFSFIFNKYSYQSIW